MAACGHPDCASEGTCVIARKPVEQIAYEAYKQFMDERTKPIQLLDWDNLESSDQVAWHKAANAVIAEYSAFFKDTQQ